MIGNLVAQEAASRHAELDALCPGHSRSPTAHQRLDLSKGSESIELFWPHVSRIAPEARRVACVIHGSGGATLLRH
jgi:hypothetical protein